MAQVKIGQRVPWCDVPSGSLVEDAQGWHVRKGGRGWTVCAAGGVVWGSFARWSDGEAADTWRWGKSTHEVRIAALNLTGHEDGVALRRLANRADILDALRALGARYSRRHDAVRIFVNGTGHVLGLGASEDEAWEATTDRLHTAGWRPGMTAATAVRGLAGVGA